jgi:L-fuconolactonase
VSVYDSHVHFWRIRNPGHAWPDAAWPLLYRDFGPTDLQAAIAGTDIAGVVVVQSQPDDRDTDWLLERTADTALVSAVVGWVDLASAAASARISRLAQHPKLRGLRPMLQGIDATEWILRRELEPALQTMLEHGLRFDALIQPRHLPAIMELARRWPALPIVIDHGAKPNIAAGKIEPWRSQIAELGLFPNIWCKLSGLRTEQTLGAPAAQLEPYVRHLVETFQDRLMWGSDWPVLLHARDHYSDWLQTSIELATRAGANRESLLAGAASKFYGLG